MAQNTGLLIGAVVAVIAVVGLVMIGGTSNTAAASICGHLEMVQLAGGQWGLICTPGPHAPVPAYGLPDIRHESVVWSPGIQEPFVPSTIQTYRPFWTIQEADARRQAIAAGGYEAVSN